MWRPDFTRIIRQNKKGRIENPIRDHRNNSEYFDFLTDLRNSHEYHTLGRRRAKLKDNTTKVRRANDKAIGTLLDKGLIFHYGCDQILADKETKLILNNGSLTMQFSPSLFYLC